MLKYDDFVEIKLIKVKDELGKFTHWEHEVKFSENWYASGGTGPTFYDNVDSALDYIMDTARYWTGDDANDLP